MSDIPNGVCRVGERRPRRTERKHPYYRSHSRLLQTESCAFQQLDDRRQQEPNKWSRCRLNEDGLYHSSSQSFDRSRRHNDWHSERHLGPLQNPSHSALRNCYSSNSGQGFRVQRADIFQDWSAEMADSQGNRIHPTKSKAQERKTDQQNLEFKQQQTRSTEMPPPLSRNWADMVELEELAAEQQNSEFETEYYGQCPGQVEDAFERVPVREYVSSHMHQNSMMSNSSSFGSDSTNESKKMKMSATPRFTESELNTKEVQVIIARRKKQIQYGKVLDCYQRYIQVVSRHKRTKYHPRTPDIYRNYSRRGFDTLVRTWKKQLHAWDPVDVDSSGRSMKLGSTCVRSITTHTTDDMKTCKKEVKEDLSIDNYDSNFPPLPTSAKPKTAASSRMHSFCSSTTVKAETSNDDTHVCVNVVKTENPDDYFQ